MKPIKLEIEGLHSFIEKQTINFEDIKGLKLFGVFGPTGSGKSTILDAMILALYGNVGRSKTNSDFINLKSKQTRVAFAFELTNHGKTKKFEIVRVYKKKKNDEVEQTSEVFELTSFGKNQIAEGALKVDNFVKENVGLTENEFTKCVALQQGEFAGFLKARPNERINLIGSIFDLNKYGQELWDKLKAKASEKEKEVAILDGKIELYKDATEESLQTLTNKSILLNESFETNTNEIEKLEVVLKEEYELAENTKELNEVNRLLGENAGLGATIADKKEAIKKARRIIDNDFLIQSCKVQNDSIAKEKLALDDLIKQKSHEEEITKDFLASANSVIENCQNSLTTLAEQKVKMEVAKENNEKLNSLNNLRSEIIEESSSLELIRVDLSQQKNTLSNNLKRLKSDIEKERKEYQTICTKIAELDVIKNYNNLSDRLSLINKYIKFADDKMNRALNLKTKTNEKISKCLQEEQLVINQLDELRKSVWENENVAYPIDVIDREIKKRYILLNTCNVTEEFIAGKNATAIELQKLIENKKLKISQQNGNLATKSLEYEQALSQIKEQEEVLSKLTEQKDAIVAQNSVVEFSDRFKIGDNCPICKNEIISKNIIGKLSTLVVDGQINEAKKELGKLVDKQLKINSEISQIKGIISEIESEIAELTTSLAEVQKSVTSKCEKILNRKKVGLNDLAIAELKIKQELSQLEKSKKSENKLIEKINNLNIDKIKYNMSFISASEKCNEYLQLIDNLVTEKQLVEADMQLIARNESEIGKKTAELNILLLNRTRLEESITNLQNNICEHEETMRTITEMYATKESAGKLLAERLKVVSKQITELQHQLKGYENVSDYTKAINDLSKSIESNKKEIESRRKSVEEITNKLNALNSKYCIMSSSLFEHQKHYDADIKNLNASISEVGINSFDEIDMYRLTEKEIKELEEVISDFDNKIAILMSKAQELNLKINGRQSVPSLIDEMKNKIEKLEEVNKVNREEYGKLATMIENKKTEINNLTILEQDRDKLNKELNIETELLDLLRGKALLEYVAEEYINDISFMASNKLQELMDGQYVLKYEDKEFYVLDNFNNGIRRPVNTLSGGEIFVVSLALALSISDAIMSRSDKRMDFFFLDEGFGTLDKDYCEYIVGILNKLKSPNMTIGIISHIPELQEKIQLKFIVEKPTTNHGSIIKPMLLI